MDFGLEKVKWVDMWGMRDLSEDETLPEPFSTIAGEAAKKMKPYLSLFPGNHTADKEYGETEYDQ